MQDMKMQSEQQHRAPGEQCIKKGSIDKADKDTATAAKNKQSSGRLVVNGKTSSESENQQPPQKRKKGKSEEESSSCHVSSSGSSVILPCSSSNSRSSSSSSGGSSSAHSQQTMRLLQSVMQNQCTSQQQQSKAPSPLSFKAALNDKKAVFTPGSFTPSLPPPTATATTTMQSLLTGQPTTISHRPISKPVRGRTSSNQVTSPPTSLPSGSLAPKGHQFHFELLHQPPPNFAKTLSSVELKDSKSSDKAVKKTAAGSSPHQNTASLQHLLLRKQIQEAAKRNFDATQSASKKNPPKVSTPPDDKSLLAKATSSSLKVQITSNGLIQQSPQKSKVQGIPAATLKQTVQNAAKKLMEQQEEGSSPKASNKKQGKKQPVANSVISANNKKPTTNHIQSLSLDKQSTSSPSTLQPSPRVTHCKDNLRNNSSALPSPAVNGQCGMSAKAERSPRDQVGCAD